jgi:hypothetical protein
MMSTDKKRLFIFEKIKNINNHTSIIDFIKEYSILYTQNTNGFFINISSLDDEKIDLLYLLINNIIYTESLLINKYYYNEENENNENDNKNEIKELIKMPISIKKTDIFLSDYNNDNKKLIKRSKTYKFE